MMTRYGAKFFAEKEFDCKCQNADCPMKGDRTPYSAIIVIALDLIRERVKMPVRVNSGGRCEPHNKAVGGDPNSRHKKKEAADISAADYNALVCEGGEVCDFLGLRVKRYDKERFLHIQEK